MNGGSKKIYCISGLAADHRLFGKLSIPGYELVALPWVQQHKSDTLAGYAAKMAACIPDASPIIIGLSMGGMVAVEIGKIVQAKAIIIVSSAKTGAEVGRRPAVLEWLGKNGVVPTGWLNIPFPAVLRQLGAATAEEKALLRTVIRDSDPSFMKWAIRAILSWDNTAWPGNVFHIHGTADKVLRPRFVSPNVWVEGGSHIMILNRAAEVSSLITDHLSSLPL